MGSAIRDTVTDVTQARNTPCTGVHTPARVGRKSSLTGENLQTILHLARENLAWGLRRLIGELAKLQITVGRHALRRVLKEDGLFPDPQRRQGG